MHAGSNLDVKRVKYQHKNTSPNCDEKNLSPIEDQKEFSKVVGSTSQFAAGHQDSHTSSFQVQSNTKEGGNTNMR